LTVKALCIIIRILWKQKLKKL